MNDHPSPSTYNVPHDHWRKGQYEAAQNILNSKRRFVIAAAPVGSGKSAVGAALGSRGRSVRVLTHTRALQDQYRKYGFDVLYGMSAYPCALNPVFSADMCSHSEHMNKCTVSHLCEYLTARETTKVSTRQSLSYAYFMAADWPKGSDVDYLYQDEAHLLPDIVMAQMTIEITPSICKKLGIKTYPLANMDSQAARRIQVTRWAIPVLNKLVAEIKYLQNVKEKSEYEIRKLRMFKHTHTPLLSAIDALNNMPEHFWIKSDHESLRIVPLTAAPFYKNSLASGGEKIVMTSATIGNPRTFAGSLGLGSNEYDWINTQSNFGPNEMPVFVYKDAPKMRYGMSDNERKDQVNLIRRIIQDRNPTWNTLIHTSSIRDAKWIASELSRYFDDRVYLPSTVTNTAKKIENWKHQIMKKPGTIALAWSFHAGLDAPDVNINIIQKIPFAPLDEPGKALLDLNPKFYSWRAANMVEQACGRTRRGEPSHYEEQNMPEKKHVAILDQNIRRVKGQTSDHFQRCLNYI